MKLLIVCLALAITAVCAAPYDWNSKIEDNSLIETPENVLEEDWQLVPDADGRLHLVDINHVDMEFETKFNSRNQIVFQLFTRGNPNSGQVIGLNNVDQLRASNFNPSHPTRIIIHGWNNDGRSDINTHIRNAYITRGNFNVFVLDWGAGANTINYITARNRVNDVGAILGEFLQFLNNNRMSFSTLTVIGHSLGAHAAGIAGKQLARGRIQTIIALDAALPLFSMDRPNDRVHSGDANYVESIHTDIGRLGFDQPLGDASFYPNNGGPHPGCGIFDLAGICAHSRSWQFFAESINSTSGFWATRCRNYNDIRNNNCVSSGPNQRMGGEPSSTRANGVYFLRTNNASPFAQGQRL